ncbi:hypothetical protein KBC86_00360 [Candidatus Gracilibacteria bacterium]|nr:hypothetical protein [Candidatus Gracilibacteria bacterium]
MPCSKISSGQDEDISEETYGTLGFCHCEERSNPVVPGTWIATSFFEKREKLLAMTEALHS